jgi:peptidoglycan-N-acetylglucosamine deacetylase
MNILTFDIEEWFHIQFDEISAYHKTKSFEKRLPVVLHQILNRLDIIDTKATFLCLGWVGEVYPELIREIHKRGHEIGSHTNDHKLVHSQKPEEFRKDLRQSIETLTDLTGSSITTFRAPAFSINNHTDWAYEVLIEEGIEIDLSLFPSKRDFGGNTEHIIEGPQVLKTKSGNLKELPINFSTFLGKKLIYSGGGYFRLTPYNLTKKFMKSSDYTMCYFHARDFDPGQPILDGLSQTRKFKSYYGLKSAWGKFENLTNDFTFLSVKQASEFINWDNVPHIDI